MTATQVVEDVRQEQADERDEPIPNIAHFFCVVQEAKGDHRGLCGCKVQGRLADGDEVVCAVCEELVNPHRLRCDPCYDRWGLKT